jgi:hypothetical protein
MNCPEVSFGVSENRLSPLSPLHKWRGEALRKSEAKVGLRGIQPIEIKKHLLSSSFAILYI